MSWSRSLAEGWPEWDALQCYGGLQLWERRQLGELGHGGGRIQCGGEEECLVVARVEKGENFTCAKGRNYIYRGISELGFERLLRIEAKEFA